MRPRARIRSSDSAEALAEFSVSPGEQGMGGDGTSVTLPQGRETHRDAKLPRQCHLLSCDFESAQQLRFGGRAGAGRVVP
jgi:hypothetical protein